MSQQISVMTYNIKAGQGSGEVALPAGEAPASLQRIADVIRQSEADIVGLQEVDRYWSRSGGIDQPEELGHLLEMRHCHGANVERVVEGGANPAEYGTAVLSAFPILECRNVPLPTPEGWEQRGALTVTIQLPEGEAITLINTHLQVGHAGAEAEAQQQRREQLDAVLEIAGRALTPVVVTGDFNALPGSDELSALESGDLGFVDAWAACNPADPGFTFPSHDQRDPERRIDYILVGQGVTVRDIRVLIDDRTRATSDHFPVIADLILGQPGATPVATPAG